ncbi:S1 RNA-binding domain-containing protein [Amphibacillus cookii]|uniref:CvfB family protein n=1 Tax=Amphibacillus cookii TaxID=767787 RepID=UPI0019573F80|nr:S1-like domain-containing RNA-binding protein [Amphibacillus cookii]MBM7540817.1 putative RNA-binding protein (virulence factor B family) [Amphibacillus cookii]
MAKIQPGEVMMLTVLREIETGYVLTDHSIEILLHKNETTRTLKESEEVEVFVYHDKQNKCVATMVLPNVRYDLFDWAEVTEIKEGLGVFVNIGTTKDVLVSVDDLPLLRTVWPEIGDQLYVTLKQDKKGRLLADPVSEADFEGNWDLAPESMLNNDISGRVFRSGREGAVVITEEGYRGFIHHTQRKQELRLGEWVNGRVIKVKADGSLNISLIPRKKDAQALDAETILSHLKAQQGVMEFDNQSDPEAIKRTFNLSKAAFKRAIGKLYKERLIKQEDGKTYLLERKD